MLRKHLELDLIAIVVLTSLLVAVVLTLQVPFLREVLGLIFIFFVPGYVLVAASFTRQDSVGKTTYLALSLVLSITVAVFIGLILSVSPWGFTLNSFLIAMSVFVLVISGVAWFRRHRNNQQDESVAKSSAFSPGAVQSFRAGGRGYRSLVIFLLCAILGGLGSVCYILARPVPVEPFSEFYVLGTGGKAEGYPRELDVGEEGWVIVGIVSHEHREKRYHIRIEASGTQLYDLPDITLEPGEKWEKEVSLALQQAGRNLKVEFFLYTDAGVPDETRYVWVNVTE